MSIRYTKIRKSPKTFQRLFGISIVQFEEIFQNVLPVWEEEIYGRYKRPGRGYKLDLSDMILMLLLYYRSYITQVFVGYLFGIDDSRVCRIIQGLEPILASVMAIKKQKHLSKEEVESLIIDVTEQPIERPAKSQRKYYSGKKKRHTLKTEIRVTRRGRIVGVSKSHPGSIHDFTLFKKGKRVFKDVRILTDSGYQGIDKIHQNADFPYKATKLKPLELEEKEYNRALSRARVIVENIIGDIKNFKIISDRYRNKRKRYGIKFHIISGIVNLKNGFATA